MAINQKIYGGWGLFKKDAIWFLIFFSVWAVFIVGLLALPLWSQFQIDLKKAYQEDYALGIILVYVIMYLLLFVLLIIPIWVISKIYSKIVLTSEFLIYRGRKINYSDILKVGRKEMTIWLPFGVPTPVEQKLPAVSFKERGRRKVFDLPGWLTQTDFYEELQKRNPRLKIQIPAKPESRPRKLSLRALVRNAWGLFRIIFAAILLVILSIVLIGWLINLPFSYFGSFNFRQFIIAHQLVQWIVMAVGGVVVTILFGGLSFGLVYIEKREFRKMFFKVLLILGGLYFLGWLLYYFGILK